MRPSGYRGGQIADPWRHDRKVLHAPRRCGPRLWCEIQTRRLLSLPERDENVAAINRIIDRIIADRAITKVDDIVYRLNLNKRALQRTFHEYVGVSPKWVIKRYRLHEAAEQLAAGDGVDWPRLALDLGYFDQAHFIKDFKAIVGTSPAEYAKNIG